MRILNKLFIWFFLFGIVFFVGMYVFISFQGQQLVTEKLSALLHKQVSARQVRMILPLGIRIDDFDIEKTLKAKEVRVQLGVLSLIQKDLHITSLSLTDPFIIVKNTEESGITLGDAKKAESAPKDPSPEEMLKDVLNKDKKKKAGLVIDSLMAENGKVQFLNSAHGEIFEFTLEDVDLKAFNVAVPQRPMKTRFDFKASVFQSPLNLAGSLVEGYGWMNVHQKDMDAKIKVIDRKGQVALDTQMTSEKNDMKVKGQLNISNLKKSSNKAASKETDSFKDVIFEALQSSGVNIGVEFNFRTKMDDFEIGQVKFSGVVGHEPVVPSAAEAIADDLKDIGRQIEEFSRELYNKDKQPEEENKVVEEGVSE